MSITARQRRRATPPRWRTQLTLALAVTAAHLWLAGHVLPDRLGEGAADARPRRIEVAFVRELAPAAPPKVAPAPARRPRPRAVAPSNAASAARPGTPAEPAPPAPAVQAPAPTPTATADGVPMPVAEGLVPTEEPTPGPAPPSDTATTGPVPALPVPELSAAAASASASAPADFEWPPSTRLSYRLAGNYRGPVEGQAQVEWLRSGTRYQVFMDLSIGPAFAPLMSRRVSSEGDITPAGLRPRRYDEETRVVLRDPRHLTIQLDADSVSLPDGSQLPRPAGVQDSASQFVQLTWLFTMQPALLQPGVSIEMPLALPRRIQTWTYDVLGAETLPTPAGDVQALHIKPRRAPRPGGDLTAEIWVAPSLQYLPVRILIRQDAETYLDLVIERLPLQAAPGR